MKFLIIALYVVSIGCFFSCDNEKSELREWTPLKAIPNDDALFTSVKHNDQFYLFFGSSGNYLDYKISPKIWIYDAKVNKWTSKNYNADYLPAKINAQSFMIGDTAYIVGGEIMPYLDQHLIYHDQEYSNEFLKYIPSQDKWRLNESNPFPGQGRVGGTAFSIGEYGYFGFGKTHEDPYVLRDFWRFDQVSNNWERLPDFPGGLPDQFVDGSDIKAAFVYFVFDNSFVILTGNKHDSPELWSFDVNENEWTQITDIHFADEYAQLYYFARTDIVSVVYKEKGYVFGGHWLNKEIFNPSVYCYDPATTTWSTASNYPGDNRELGSFGFAMDDCIILGFSSRPPYYPGEVWKYLPKAN